MSKPKKSVAVKKAAPVTTKGGVHGGDLTPPITGKPRIATPSKFLPAQKVFTVEASQAPSTIRPASPGGPPKVTKRAGTKRPNGSAH
jgi:hypothetical protein